MRRFVACGALSAVVSIIGCSEESPVGITQLDLPGPNDPAAIDSTNLGSAGDFATGYGNGNIRSDQVYLEWEPSADKDFLGYKIYRADGVGDDRNYSLRETLNDTSVVSFQDDSGLGQDRWYTYRIATIIESGTHAADHIEVKTPRWLPPGNVNYEILSPTTATITWADNSESEMNFEVGNGATTVTVGANTTTYTATDLELDNYYGYSVKATNTWEETGRGYAPSFTITFDPPSGLNANQLSGSKAVGLTWYDNSSLENGFEIERDTGAGFEWLATAAPNVTSYTDSDTTDFVYDETYSYRVRAYNDYGDPLYTDYVENSVTIGDQSDEWSDDFEAGIPLAAEWATSGDANWFVSSAVAYQGAFSAECGDINILSKIKSAQFYQG